jgi:hypothetical protein
MKTIYLTLTVFLFAGITAFSQSSPSDKLFRGLEGKDGVTILSFSKSMLDFVDMDFDDDEKITGDLDKIKILIYNASDVKDHIDLRKDALKMLSGRYKKVKPGDIDKDASDKDDYVDIMVLRNGKKIKECHVIVADEDGGGSGLIISFFGNFKVEDLKDLANKAENYN